MKSHTILLAAAAAAICLATPRLALAQNYATQGGTSGNLNGPTVSPYLNLLQVNSQGLIPYQNLVKPQIDQQNALKAQAGAIQQLQQQVNAPSGGGRMTGHTTYFMNYSHFYRATGGAGRR